MDKPEAITPETAQVLLYQRQFFLEYLRMCAALNEVPKPKIFLAMGNTDDLAILGHFTDDVKQKTAVYMTGKS